jgi:hypothetical protein
MLMNQASRLLSGEMNLTPELNQEVLDGGFAKHVAGQQDQSDDRGDRKKGTHDGSARVDIERRGGLAATGTSA